MTAAVPCSAWLLARDRRARAGKAPRLALRRCMLLRQIGSGRWIVGIHEWRFGTWRKSQWLCEETTLSSARRVALDHWAQCKLPLFWVYAGDPGMRPFHVGVNEPQAVRS